MKKHLKSIGIHILAYLYIPIIVLGGLLLLLSSIFKIIAMFLFMDFDNAKREYEALKKLIKTN